MKYRTLLPAMLLLAGALVAMPAHAQEGRPIAVQAQLHELAGGGLHLVPERIDAKVGDTLTVEVLNQGQSRHNLVFCKGPIQGATCADKWAFTRLLDGNASQTITFEVTEAGTFEYFCDVPGHRQGGMRGELVVQGEAKKESPGLAPALALSALALLALTLRRR